MARIGLRAQLGEKLLRVLQEAPDLGQQFQPLRRQRDLARRADEQAHPELLLEFADAVAERGLGDAQMRRRAMEAAALGDGEKGLQSQEI